MSEAKHTPGPWLLVGETIYKLNDEPATTQSNRFHARVDTGWISWAERTPVAELEANARLIAAAPELLEELQYLVEIAETAMRAANRDGGEYDIGEMLERPRAAIAKATGTDKEQTC